MSLPSPIHRRMAALTALAAIPLLAACGHTRYTTRHVVECDERIAEVSDGDS